MVKLSHWIKGNKVPEVKSNSINNYILTDGYAAWSDAPAKGYEYIIS